MQRAINEHGENANIDWRSVIMGYYNQVLDANAHLEGSLGTVDQGERKPYNPLGTELSPAETYGVLAQAQASGYLHIADLGSNVRIDVAKASLKFPKFGAPSVHVEHQIINYSVNQPAGDFLANATACEKCPTPYLGNTSLNIPNQSSGEIREWQPNWADNWSESGNIIKGAVYGLLDGFYVTGQTFLHPFGHTDVTHLTGEPTSGWDNTDALITVLSTLVPTGPKGAGATSNAVKSLTSANGIKITGFVRHAVNRAIGSYGRKGVSPRAILDALKNPLKINKIVTDNLGRQSQRFIGQFGEVVVNPQTGKIISVNPTSTSKAAKLLGR